MPINDPVLQEWLSRTTPDGLTYKENADRLSRTLAEFNVLYSYINAFSPGVVKYQDVYSLMLRDWATFSGYCEKDKPISYTNVSGQWWTGV